MKRKLSPIIALSLLLSHMTVACSSTRYYEPTVVEGGKTILIYMCGSNLETYYGLASKNIDELLSASIDDSANIIIQTGGSNTWKKHNISATKSERYAVKDGELKLISSSKNKNMGSSDTLTDFLSWSDKYLSETNMLIFWDHGGGSAKGVCFDENYDYDPLTLPEIKTAFERANMHKKFDVIGFDACLMGSIETAYCLKDDAAYMVASEEIEPGGGWDYKALAESFNSKKDTYQISKDICDSYLSKSTRNGKHKYSTLSVFDLSKADAAITRFGDFVDVLKKNVADKNFGSFISDSLNKSERVGGDRTENGGSNMVDIISFISQVALKVEDDIDYMWPAIYDLVPYSVNGQDRFTCGMSFYYPELYERDEIENYICVGACPKYNDFLSKYYLNVPSKTIEYVNKGIINDDGLFEISLTSDSNKYLSAMNYYLMEKDENGVEHILSVDNDIISDWDNMSFKVEHKNIRLALDGHPLFYKTISSTNRYVKYTAPIKVNGEKTNLRFIKLFEDSKDSYYVYGTWDGFDENGLPSNEYRDLQKGDRIQLVTDVIMDSGLYSETYGEEFMIGDNGAQIDNVFLPKPTYDFAFVAMDIFNSIFISDITTI